MNAYTHLNLTSKTKKFNYQKKMTRKLSCGGTPPMDNVDAPEFIRGWRGWGLKGGCAVDNVKN